MFRNNKFFSIHGDHLGTPRQMRSEANQVLWQWPYSAFGDNPPSGMLKATPRPNAAITHQPLLKATKPPQALDLRFAGQYADAHAGQFYNLHRMYLAGQGRYTQFDPIGLAGGLNGYLYAEASPLMFTDPGGLQAGAGAGGNSGVGSSSPSGAEICNEPQPCKTILELITGSPHYCPVGCIPKDGRLTVTTCGITYSSPRCICSRPGGSRG